MFYKFFYRIKRKFLRIRVKSLEQQHLGMSILFDNFKKEFDIRMKLVDAQFKILNRRIKILEGKISEGKSDSSEV